MINVKNGVIKGIKFYEYFFGIGNSEEIEALLIGRLYKDDEIKAALAEGYANFRYVALFFRCASHISIKISI